MTAEATDDEYRRAKAGLDHLAAHHGMRYIVCPPCGGDGCDTCDGSGRMFAFDPQPGFKNCGAADCPLPRNVQ